MGAGTGGEEGVAAHFLEFSTAPSSPQAPYLCGATEKPRYGFGMSGVFLPSHPLFLTYILRIHVYPNAVLHATL